MVSRLTTDPSVGNQELMSFARHTSATSQLPYVRSGENSNCNFQMALQSVALPSQRKIQRKKEPAKKAVKVKQKAMVTKVTATRRSGRIAAKVKITRKK